MLPSCLRFARWLAKAASSLLAKVLTVERLSQGHFNRRDDGQPGVLSEIDCLDNQRLNEAAGICGGRVKLWDLNRPFASNERNTGRNSGQLSVAGETRRIRAAPGARARCRHVAVPGLVAGDCCAWSGSKMNRCAERGGEDC